MEEGTDDDTVTVDGDDSELSISVSVGEVSVEVSGRADNVEVWYGYLKNDFLEHLDEETIRAAAESSGPTVTTPPVGDGASGENGAHGNGDTPSTDDDTENHTPDRTLPEYYKMAGGGDLTKKDRALLVGWFLTQQGEDRFSKTDVTEKAEEARMILGSNVSRDLGYQVADGHINQVDESDGSPVYQMTITGEEYVKAELLGTDE